MKDESFHYRIREYDAVLSFKHEDFTKYIGADYWDLFITGKNETVRIAINNTIAPYYMSLCEKAPHKDENGKLIYPFTKEDRPSPEQELEMLELAIELTQKFKTEQGVINSLNSIIHQILVSLMGTLAAHAHQPLSVATEGLQMNYTYVIHFIPQQTKHVVFVYPHRVVLTGKNIPHGEAVVEFGFSAGNPKYYVYKISCPDGKINGRQRIELFHVATQMMSKALGIEIPSMDEITKLQAQFANDVEEVIE